VTRHAGAALCRRTKNNPALIGTPGNGRREIVHGPARRIAAGDVPGTLQQQRIYHLDVASVLNEQDNTGQRDHQFAAIRSQPPRGKPTALPPYPGTRRRERGN
jgi:ATP-dependent Clp protease ATP-binding subunit ClpA